MFENVGFLGDQKSLPVLEKYAETDPYLLPYIYIYIYIYIYKWYLNAASLNTQHFEVRIKGKEDQPKERSSALLYTSV